jgi:hypothetical protein
MCFVASLNTFSTYASPAQAQVEVDKNKITCGVAHCTNVRMQAPIRGRLVQIYERKGYHHVNVGKQMLEGYLQSTC